MPFFVACPKLFTLMNDSGNNLKKELREVGGKNIQVRKIEMNGKETEIVKLGEIADVKVGLQTGDNDAYLFQNPGTRGSYRSIEDYEKFLLTEDDLKIIRANDKLRLSIAENGISKDNKKNGRYFQGRYIVPHDKGGESDSESGWLPNYYVKTNYYIDWSEQAVDRIKTLAGKDGRPKSRFQNINYYFVKGIDYSQTGIYCPTFRINSGSIFNTEATSIFCPLEVTSLLGYLCSKMTRFFIKNFIDNSVHASADKLNETTIFLNIEQKNLTNLINSIIGNQKNNARYDYSSHEQIEIDRLVYLSYGLNNNDISEVENWYARRYPKLSSAQKANLRKLGKSDDYLVLYGLK
jgi:hypothetical protein